MFVQTKHTNAAHHASTTKQKRTLLHVARLALDLLVLLLERGELVLFLVLLCWFFVSGRWWGGWLGGGDAPETRAAPRNTHTRATPNNNRTSSGAQAVQVALLALLRALGASGRPALDARARLVELGLQVAQVDGGRRVQERHLFCFCCVVRAASRC